VGDGNGREKWLGCGCGPLRLNYRKQGYAVTRRGGANADGGIDLVIEMNGMRAAVQCKHWKTWNVGATA
jgi:Restriction endonuclease